MIRPERSGDGAAIQAVHAAAFRSEARADQTPTEVGLVDALRAGDAWIPALSLVAVVHGKVVGHCLSTRAHVDEHRVLGLGPIGVMPDLQGRGIGSMLMEATIETADVHGEALIGLLGDPRFYARFGFVLSSELAIVPADPTWARAFQVRPLAAYRAAIAGTFRYAAPFDDVEERACLPDGGADLDRQAM